jgi:hypothetical protein
VYAAITSDIRSGRQYRALENDSPLPFLRFFDLLEMSAEFADWYTATLAAFEAEAYYWELPPITRATIGTPAEFVLIEAPMLARIPPEPAPFASHFERAAAEDVIVFPNLGGDATLVVPCPRGPDEHYPHLGAFLRSAPKQQVRALWRRTAQQMLRSVGDKPVWLSTAGGGVAWLHLRLDSRPKYYSHAPYRRPSIRGQ